MNKIILMYCQGFSKKEIIEKLNIDPKIFSKTISYSRYYRIYLREKKLHRKRKDIIEKEIKENIENLEKKKVIKPNKSLSKRYITKAKKIAYKQALALYDDSEYIRKDFGWIWLYLTIQMMNYYEGKINEINMREKK